MELEFIPGQYSVCKIAAPGPEILFYTAQPYCFIGKTDEEFSLVCQTEIAPEDIADREDGWCAFRITGTLDFSLIGILAPIA
ncbi:MAG: ACT domain-containing protein, partial [Clostridia bacterium]|nr:ACT domain-containing protein [Clostridia bacterium]